MKNWFVGIILLCTACSGNNVRILEGTVSPELKGGKLYLCEVVNEYRGSHRIIDSVAIVDGKFRLELKDVKPELYFLGDNVMHGGYVFVDGKKIRVASEEVTDESIVWNVSGSPLDGKYRDYGKLRYVETGQKVLDSLDGLFYKAREIRDTAEMRRIKELSAPYYDNARIRQKELTERLINANKDNIFGLYLYYSQKFQHKDFPTAESIAQEKEYVNSFGNATKDSRYLTKILDQLKVYENCAIGSVAPEIVGVDTLGNPLKLTDLRGKYVIVDFWNSYCKWCRLETPWLQKAKDAFADKDFVILGVSSDYYKDKWMEAIHEDKSCWIHMLVDKKDHGALFDAYCIKGIPHIILIAPDGKILAKELRGDDITNVTATFLK